MKFPLFFTVIIIFVSIKLFAQNHGYCGIALIETQMKATQPAYLSAQRAYEKDYQRHLNTPSVNRRTAIPFVFPVVVHIIHDCATIGTSSNPTDAAIRQILSRTTKRFRHTHNGAQAYKNPRYGVDTQIEFCLANIDPEGNYTNGVVRYADAANSRGKSSDLASYFSEYYSWDATKYLNIFIVADTDVAGVYLGGSKRDFIIINASSLWDGLLVHEIGHYFSLKHVFAPDSEETCSDNFDCLTEGDFVCDTPPKNLAGMSGGTCEMPANSCNTDENDSSDKNPYRSINIGGMGDQPDMLANYMDYTAGCWDAFTEGQKERMHFNIESRRMSLVDAAIKLCQPNLPLYEVAITDVELMQLPCSVEWSTKVILTNNGLNSVASLNIDFEIGENTFSFLPSFELAPDSTTTIVLPSLKFPVGSNDLFINISAPNGMEDAYANNNQYCRAIHVVGEHGQSILVNETLSNCRLPSSFQLNNAPDVRWDIGQANTALRACHPCFATIQAFSKEAQAATLCLPKMDMRAYPDAQLTFSLGYIPRYESIRNNLKVYASADCGEQELLFSSGGLDLATNTPPAYSENGVNQIPDCDAIKAVEIDLSTFAGQSNVHICFEAEGRWYSPLILDEIIVSSKNALEIEQTNDCQPLTFTKEVSTCKNEVVEGYVGPGTFRDTFTLASGCDSIRILNIFVTSQRVVTQVERSICEGASFEGHTQKGAYIDVFTSINGCDSVRILNIYVLLSVKTNINATICEEDNYEGYKIQGTYVDTFQLQNGCDSIRVLKLVVDNSVNCITTPTYEVETSPLIRIFPNPASGQLHIDWYGQEFLTYSIFTITGVPVQRAQILKEATTLSLTNWVPGLYLIHFQSPKGHFVKKVLVEF